MISVKNIRKTYQMGKMEVRALDGVSLDIKTGEYVAIIGASGSGKSTLMHILGLLDIPDEGKFEIDGKDVTKFKENEIASLRNRVMGFVFQQFNLLKRTSALENVGLPLIYSRNGKRASSAKKMLDLVGLKDRMTHHPNELSGGQQQRVAIARALVNDPSIILADEPTGNLDSQSAREIMEVLGDLHARGLTILLVTHDQNVAAHAQRIIEISDGKIVKDEANPNAPEVKEIKDRPVGKKRRRLFGIHALLEIFILMKQSIRSLLANKVRTSLSALGIMIGVAAVISTVGLTAGAEVAMTEQLSKLGKNLLMLYPDYGRRGGVRRTSRRSRITLADVEAIRAMDSVKYVSGVSDGSAQLKYKNQNWPSSVSGMEPDYEWLRSDTPIAGRFFTQEECDDRERVAVIGHTPMVELFGEENPIGKNIKINRQAFRVIGVLPEKGTGYRGDEDDYVYIPLQTAMRRLFGRKYLYRVDIQIRSAEELEQAEKDILELMAIRHRAQNRDNPFQTFNASEIQDIYKGMGRVFSILMSSVATISLAVGGIGIMNIMLVSVTERTREIGLRKALGARRRDIMIQFLIEALVIGFFGGCIGVAIGSGVSMLLAKATEWAIVITKEAVFISFGFSALIGMIFGLWPARKAAKLNPIEALRYE